MINFVKKSDQEFDTYFNLVASCKEYLSESQVEK